MLSIELRRKASCTRASAAPPMLLADFRTMVIASSFDTTSHRPSEASTMKSSVDAFKSNSLTSGRAVTRKPSCLRVEGDARVEAGEETDMDGEVGVRGGDANPPVLVIFGEVPKRCTPLRFNSTSPNARDTASDPSTRHTPLKRTRPPASIIRRFSSGRDGFWSSLNASTLLPLPSTALESPTLTTVSRRPDRRHMIPVVPS
mmetsp:Transcript_37761/g.97418  ORF Transcript_37761/g.97418 Transcript_37761/m.97418 type:complete len:202 (-) Transcript_37761:617-1222(-)